MTDTAAAGDRKSFWETLPGILTGVAAVLSALAGLITVIIRTNPSPPPAVSSPVSSEVSIPSHARRVRAIPTFEKGPAIRYAQVGGLWRDEILGMQVRVRQAGDRITSETYDPVSGRRLAMGSGRISGHSIEGINQWADGNRYLAVMTVSADGQEMTGTARHVITGVTAPVHLVR